MNDDAVISRLRSALDEVASAADGEVISLRSGRLRRRNGVLLTASAAACVALLGAAAWVFSHRDPDPVATAPEPTAFVPVSTSVAPTTTVAPTQAAHRFALAAQDLSPGPITERQTAEPAGSRGFRQSWRVQGDGLDGFLFASIFPNRPDALPSAQGGETINELQAVPYGRAWLLPDTGNVMRTLFWARSDGTLWTFEQQGLEQHQGDWVTLVLQAVPGSGVPIVVADPRATMLSVGTSTTMISQTFTGAAGFVQLDAVDSGELASDIVGAGEVRSVTIAGHEGWLATFSDGHLLVVWPDADGWWGAMTISAGLASRADGLIAAVIDLQATTPATPVPAPSAPAVTG